MFNLGMPELIIIFIVALLVFGPKKLPELGKSLGRAMGEFRRTSQEIRDSLESEVETSKIKEELLEQQKEVQQSLTEASKVYTEEEKPAETAEEKESGTEKTSGDA